MKKLFLLTTIILLTGFTFGQVLPKGTLIGTHTATITLQPGVTMEQVMKYLTDKYIPSFNKYDPNWQVYLVKSVRGDISKNSIGFIHVIKTEKDRNKYYNADESASDLGKSRTEKLTPIVDEFKKLATMTTVYTDWVVQ
jgi:hypothetical protein